MSAITVGTSPIEPATASASRPAASSDPDAFAAELASVRSGSPRQPEGHTARADDRSTPTAADKGANAAPVAATPDTTTASPTEGSTDPAVADVPSGERRERRHAAADSTGDAAPGAVTGAVPGAAPTPAGTTAALDGVISTALSPNDPAVASASPVTTAASAAAAAPDSLGAAPSPSSAAPSNTSGPHTADAAMPVASPAPASGSRSTDAPTPSAPAADPAAQDAAPAIAPARSRPAAGSQTTTGETESAGTASALTVTAAAASLAVESAPSTRLASKASSGRPADPGALPGAAGLSPTSSTSAATGAAPTPATAALAAPAPATPPLNAQLAPTLFHLRSAEAGTHVLTLTVAPEAVGPVTVRAHVGADGIRIELSAPTAQGRSALDAMLPDLRRDLSQGGMNSALSLAAPNSDGSTSGRSPFDGAAGSFAGDRGQNGTPTGPGAAAAREPSTPLAASVPIHLRSGAIALDVFA